jgi:hypothetical protein
MSKGDFDGFMRFFRDYTRHLCQYPNSFLARVYGIYQIKIGIFEPVYMMIMGNGMQVNKQTERRLHLYDLKGSKSGRLNKKFGCATEGSSEILLDQNL